MKNKKKMVAAISAVMNYIKTEEEIISAQAVSPVEQFPPAQVSFKLWSISGRQAQMQTRNLMQMRLQVR